MSEFPATLQSTVGKAFARKIKQRIRNQQEETMEDSKYEFTPNRGALDAIFVIRQISENL